MNGLSLAQALHPLGTKNLKVQIGKKVFEVVGVMPSDPGTPADAFLSVAKLKVAKPLKEKQVVNLTLTVQVEVEKITKKEKVKLMATGTPDNEQALHMAKAVAFMGKAKMRGCKVISTK